MFFVIKILLKIKWMKNTLKHFVKDAGTDEVRRIASPTAVRRWMCSAIKSNVKYKTIDDDLVFTPVLVAGMISSAKQMVCIYSGNLNGKVWKQECVIDALKTFLNREKAYIYIVLQEKKSLNGRLADVLLMHFEKRIGLYVNKKCTEHKRHFIICDNKICRYEYAHPDQRAEFAINDYELFGNLSRTLKIMIMKNKKEKTWERS